MKKLLLLIFVLITAAGLVFNFWLKPKFETEKDVTKLGIAQETITPSTPEATASVTIELPSQKILIPVPHIYQTFNNCGPATLSMILANFGKNVSQKELADLMRPYQHPKGDNDDKTIFPTEFANFAQKYGFEAKNGVAADIELLKEVITKAEIPVVVKGWLKVNEDIGHFWVVRGFDEQQGMLITDDSYHGPNRKTSYANFLRLWQPFNYGYIIVYPEDKKEIVEKILANRGSLPEQYQKAVNRAQKEIKLPPDNIYPYFNLSTSYYHLADYQKSVAAFEVVENKLPRRMLWYQIEPVLAYQKLGNFERVFEITDKVLTDDNRAFSEFYQIRGEILLTQGKKEEARAEFEKAVFYNKNFTPAKEALSKI